MDPNLTHHIILNATLNAILYQPPQPWYGPIWDVLGLWGFRKNRMRQEKQDYDKKQFLLSYFRHEVRKSIELLHERQGNLIPVDAWNSIVNSGNIVLFTHDQAIVLGDIYFRTQNYNYEAKRTRDASEHFHLLPDPHEKRQRSDGTWQLRTIYDGHSAEQDREEYKKAKERWKELSDGLISITESLENDLIDLETKAWFKE
jgi:hypothetical protein